MKRLGLAGVMVGLVVVWAASARAQDAAQIKHGEEVFTAQKCSMCHSVAGKGNKSGVLDGVGSKLKAAEIEQWLKDPDAMKAKDPKARKLPMKSYGNLPKADFEALVAYLQSLKK